MVAQAASSRSKPLVADGYQAHLTARLAGGLTQQHPHLEREHSSFRLRSISDRSDEGCSSVSEPSSLQRLQSGGSQDDIAAETSSEEEAEEANGSFEAAAALANRRRQESTPEGRQRAGTRGNLQQRLSIVWGAADGKPIRRRTDTL